MCTISSFKGIENKQDVYRLKYNITKFSESLRKRAMEIINYKKKKMKFLTIELQQSYENAKVCHICQEKFEDKFGKDKKYRKVRGHFDFTGEYRGAAHSACNLKNSLAKEISIIFVNGSNYSYHSNIKKLAEGFERQFICLGQNTEK